MVYYSNTIKNDDYTVSIDNIIIDFWIPNNDAKEMIEARINCMASDVGVNIISLKGNKPGTFLQQYLFKLQEGSSFWLGHGLIATGIYSDRYRLEFNPNKVSENKFFKTIHQWLIKYCRKSLSHVARFDLAIDIPIDRSRCFLVKDRRLYIERRHGVEYTQYLGSKSASVGRVKLYNKTAEAKLDYPLTRLELTLNPGVPYEKINFPTVYYLKSTCTNIGNVKLTDTERFILNALLQGYGSVNDLGRKTRAKMEMLMADYISSVSISSKTYSEVLEQLNSYLNTKK